MYIYIYIYKLDLKNIQYNVIDPTSFMLGNLQSIFFTLSQ